MPDLFTTQKLRPAATTLEIAMLKTCTICPGNHEMEREREARERVKRIALRAACHAFIDGENKHDGRGYPNPSQPLDWRIEYTTDDDKQTIRCASVGIWLGSACNPRWLKIETFTFNMETNQ